MNRAQSVNLSSHLRPWLLLKNLCGPSPGWTLSELSEELGVSQKTVRRDLAQLQKVGFPIQQTVGTHGRKTWTCHSDQMLSKLSLTFEEAAALYLGRQFLEPMAGTVFFKAAHTAFRKIRTALTKETRQYLEQFSSVFHQTRLGSSDYRQRGEIIDTLMIAIEDQQVTRLLYFSMNSKTPKEVILHPYGLAYHRSSLYLVAFAVKYNELRHYKIARIHDIEMTSEQFEKPDEFTLHEHLRTAFGVYQGNEKQYHISVRFSADVARYVQEHHWHETQTLTPQPDGTLLLELQLSALEEFKSWILSFGAKATVEEPAELRQMIMQDLENSLKNYAVQATFKQGGNTK